MVQTGTEWYYHTKRRNLSLADSRAGVDGVGDPLVGRAAAGRVELDAEVLVRTAGVVAAEKKKRMSVTYIGGPVLAADTMY